MKGTIDITIKRKDGTVEKRQEHNVAFDLPAFTIKEYLKSNILPIYASGVYLSVLKNSYVAISLSEEERDLTKPSWRPRALRTVTSGTPSSWHTALASATNNDKKRTVTAAWTMPDDLGFSITLKSIAFDNQYIMPDRGYRSSENGRTVPLFVKDIGLIYPDGDSGYKYAGKKYHKSDFSFDNGYYSGLDTAELNSTNRTYMPYSMNLTKLVDGVQQRTQDGRFAFTDSNGNILNILTPYTVLTNKLVIFDDTTEQQVLSFPMSQFSNYVLNMYPYVYVINTGTKNWLFQYDSSINASRIWQIPDTQTSDAIAPTSETFMQGINPDTYYAQKTGIIGNYIISNNIAYRIDDDLTVTTFHGEEKGNTSGRYNVGYLDKDYVQYLVRPPVGNASSYIYSTTAGNSLIPYFANLTASNFSTPITLAAGDVLSVSYSISVGE